jgi:hypothetical protein
MELIAYEVRTGLCLIPERRRMSKSIRDELLTYEIQITKGREQ